MTPSHVDTAMQRYAACVVEHPHLTETLDDICRCLSPGMPPRILLLLGATGVGKTTLLSKLSKRLASRVASDRRIPRGKSL